MESLIREDMATGRRPAYFNNPVKTFFATTIRTEPGVTSEFGVANVKLNICSGLKHLFHRRITNGLLNKKIFLIFPDGIVTSDDRIALNL
jgi:hypothetical protein